MAIAIKTYKSEKTGKEIVDHGIDTETLETVILPPEPIDNFLHQGLCVFDEQLGCMVLKEAIEDNKPAMSR